MRKILLLTLLTGCYPKLEPVPTVEYVCECEYGSIEYEFDEGDQTSEDFQYAQSNCIENGCTFKQK